MIFSGACAEGQPERRALAGCSATSAGVFRAFGGCKRQYSPAGDLRVFDVWEAIHYYLKNHCYQPSIVDLAATRVQPVAVYFPGAPCALFCF